MPEIGEGRPKSKPEEKAGSSTESPESLQEKFENGIESSLRTQESLPTVEQGNEKQITFTEILNIFNVNKEVLTNVEQRIKKNNEEREKVEPEYLTRSTVYNHFLRNILQRNKTKKEIYERSRQFASQPFSILKKFLWQRKVKNLQSKITNGLQKEGLNETASEQIFENLNDKYFFFKKKYWGYPIPAISERFKKYRSESRSLPPVMANLPKIVENCGETKVFLDGKERGEQLGIQYCFENKVDPQKVAEALKVFGDMSPKSFTALIAELKKHPYILSLNGDQVYEGDNPDILRHTKLIASLLGEEGEIRPEAHSTLETANELYSYNDKADSEKSLLNALENPALISAQLTLAREIHSDKKRYSTRNRLSIFTKQFEKEEVIQLASLIKTGLTLDKDFLIAIEGKNQTKRAEAVRKLKNSLTILQGFNESEIRNFCLALGIGCLKDTQISDIAKIYKEFSDNQGILLETIENNKDFLRTLFSSNLDKIKTVLLKNIEHLDEYFSKKSVPEGEEEGYKENEGGYLLTDNFFAHMFQEGVEYAGLMRFLTDETLANMGKSDRHFWKGIQSKGPINKETMKNIIESRKSLGLNEPENLDTFIFLLNRIENSQSQEIRRVKNLIIDQIVGARSMPEAVQVFDEIETVFIYNNLPLQMKMYKVFAALYPKERLEKLIDSHNNPSLVLQSQEDDKRRLTIFRDLLHLGIEGGNRNLKQYLQILANGQKSVREFEETGKVDSKSKKQIIDFLNKMNGFYQASFLREWEKKDFLEDIDSKDAAETSLTDIRERLTELKKRFYVDWIGEQSLSEGFAAMFLEPLGYSSFEAVIERMDQARQEADQRGRKYYQKAEIYDDERYLSFEPGDLHKGFKPEYFLPDMEMGFTAPEYLGGESNNDLWTPFDVDLSYVYPDYIVGKDAEKNFFSALKSVVQGYGDLRIVIRPRGQFFNSYKHDFETHQDKVETKDFKPTQDDLNKYELFTLNVFQKKWGGRPMDVGIRTGFPGTEIDFLVGTSYLTTSEGQPNPQLESIFFTIAQNGYYIPVANESGEIVFSPDYFDRLRDSFRGLEFYDGERLEVETEAPPTHQTNITRLTPVLETSQQKTKELEKTITETITQKITTAQVMDGADQERNLFMRDNETTGILGVELFDTGSTARLTNVPGDTDFDILVSLDERDFTNLDIPEFADEILQEFEVIKRGELYRRSDGSYQLHDSLVNIEGQEVELDLGFVNKGKVDVLSTDQAILKRFEHIRQKQDEQAYQTTIANVVLAKEVLKEADCYKKGVSANAAEGGLGGVGVENWILANNGNFHQAAVSFLEAAYENGDWHNGDLKSFAGFRKNYEIWDPGVNLLDMEHDEFVRRNMTEEGYTKMAEVLKRYVQGEIQVRRNGKISL